MNREIRFRAWDKINKKMGEVTTLQIENGCVVSSAHEYRRMNSEVELMQSTGLKDKNGNLIFEGDILKIECKEDDVMKARAYTAVIKWDKDDACFWADDKGGTWSTALWHVYEVIGNVFENPQLIKN